jgi:hypothetical protein
MRTRFAPILAIAALLAFTGMAPAAAATGRPATAVTCSGSYGWADSTGVSPGPYYTVWIHNPGNCQQRSSGLCSNRTSGDYRRGGWVRRDGLRSAAICDSNHPFLIHLYIDIRPDSGTPYQAITLCPTRAHPC